jgi:hypothetical protein
MEALHSHEEDSCPHWSQASAVHIDTRKIIEPPPLEVVQILAIVPSQHQI